MAVTLKATQPEILAICQAMGSAVATAARPIWPWIQSQMPVAAVAVIIEAFSRPRVKPFTVTSRICRRKAAFSACTPSRTKASSCEARANSFTVWILV